MPIRGTGRCQGCNKKLWGGGTHCMKCTTGGGGTGGYRSVDLPAKTAADIRREQTQRQRAAQRSKAAAERAERHKAAIAKAAAEKAAVRAAKKQKGK